MHECIHECALAHSHAYLRMRIFPLVPCQARLCQRTHVDTQSEWHYCLRRSPGPIPSWPFLWTLISCLPSPLQASTKVSVTHMVPWPCFSEHL